MSGWWEDLFRAASWARARRAALRGLTIEPGDDAASVDFAAGALADPELADALEDAGVLLESLETLLVRGAPRALDGETFQRGVGGVAWQRSASRTTIHDAFAYLLGLPEVSEAAGLAGVARLGDGWGTIGLVAIRSALVRLTAGLWPLTGRPSSREAIVMLDHDQVSRAFVLHLLQEQGHLSAIAALRAMRRAERDGRAIVFSGSRERVDRRLAELREGLHAEGSPLILRREPLAAARRRT